MSKKGFFIFIFMFIFSSCAVVKFSDFSGNTEDLDTDSEYQYNKALSLDIPGVLSYDLEGAGGQSSVAYLTDSAFIVETFDKNAFTTEDGGSFRKEYIELLDENTSIYNFDLDISLDGSLVVLGYTKLTIKVDYVVPEPVPCEPGLTCHPVDPVPERFINLYLCRAVKESSEAYFDEPVCYLVKKRPLEDSREKDPGSKGEEVDSTVQMKSNFSESEEETESYILELLKRDFARNYAKKILARASNTGDSGVFIAGSSGFVYNDSRLDKLERFDFSRKPVKKGKFAYEEDVEEEIFAGIRRPAVAMMDMLRETGQTIIVVLTGNDAESKDDDNGGDKIVPDKDIGDDSSVGGPLGVSKTSKRKAGAVVSLPKATGKEDEEEEGVEGTFKKRPPIKPPVYHNSIKIFTLDNDTWNAYDISDAVALRDKVFLYTGMGFSVEKDGDLLRMLLLPYGSNGATLIKIEKFGSSVSGIEYLSDVLENLMVLDADVLVRDGEFFLKILIEKERSGLGLKIANEALSYELTYDGFTWKIPGDLLSKKMVRDRRKKEIMFVKRFKKGDLGLLQNGRYLVFKSKVGREIKLATRKEIKNYDKLDFAQSGRIAMFGILDDKTLSIKVYNK